MQDPFWCKHCKTEFIVELGENLNGDALVLCPTCGRRHPRQFVNGVAVSCNPPTKSYQMISVVKIVRD